VAKFADKTGREWVVEFTAGGIKRCRVECGVDLAKLSDNEFKAFVEVAGDPVKLADCLYVLCKGQHPDVTLDDFYELIAGDVLHAAASAFEGAFLSFCPSRQRETIQAMAAKNEEMTNLILDQIKAEMMTAGTPTAPSSTTVTNSAA
jgi:hypothetical protein